MPFQTKFAIVCIILLASGCSRGGSSSAVADHVSRGDAFAAKKEFRAATIEYRNALQIAPTAGDPRLKLAQAYEALGELDNALREYVRAADALPANRDVQLKAGSFLLAARRFADAETRARKVLTSDPNNTAALLLLSNAQAGKKQIEEAIAANERALALDPTRAGLHINLGVLQFVKGKTAEAEATFTQAVALAPKSADAHIALGKYYWAVNRRDAAERAFRKAVELDPRSTVANETVALLLIQSNRGPEAEQYIRAATAADPSAEATIRLADYYVSQKRYDSALSELQKIPSSDPFFVVSGVRAAIIEYTRGNRQRATTLLDEILEKHPAHGNALAYKSQFLLAGGNAVDALRFAKQAIATNAQSKHGYFALGKAQLALGERAEARRAFIEVLSREPTASEAAIELARIDLSSAQIDNAITFAKQAVESAPGSAEALLTLVRTLSARPEDARRADSILKALLASDHMPPEVHLLAGDLSLTRGDTSAARSAFERALTLEPGSLEALKRLVNLDVVQKKPDAARRRLQAIVAEPTVPVNVLLMSARFHAQQRDFGQAIVLLKRVLEKDSSNLEAYSALGAIYVAQRRLPAARAELIEAARLHPAVSTHTMIGLLYHLEGNLAPARLWYEKALALDPRAAAAANNLAWLYAESNERLETALLLAQTARAQLPTRPEVSDTLGWIYYKKEMAGMAVSMFTRSVEQDAKNPVYHYHLGLALARQGNDAAARASLQRALKLKPDFPQADDATRALQALAY